MPEAQPILAVSATQAHPAAPPGTLDLVSRTEIGGWAFDHAAPEARLQVIITANDQVVGRVTADRFRQDLAEAGIGNGCHGFRFNPPTSFAADVRYVIAARREHDGVLLARCPFVLEPVTTARTKPTGSAAAKDAPTAACRGRLEGNWEIFTRTRLAGWASDGADPDQRVGLVVTIDGRTVSRTLADRFRKDLLDAGYGNGRHGFELFLPELSPGAPHEIRIRREADGAELPGSPKTLPAASGLDPDTMEWIAGLLAKIDTDARDMAALEFLATQTDLLLSRWADRKSGRAARLAKAQFQRRWGGSAREDMAEARPDEKLAPRALVVDDLVPDPGRDAGSKAILSHMRALAALGFEVTFAASRAMEDRLALKRLEDGEGIKTCGTPHYYTIEDILKRQDSCFDVIYLHRLSNAGNYLALARTYQPKARILYSVADLHHLRLCRQGEIEQRQELVTFSRGVALREMTAARQADAVITHSPHEASLLAEIMPRQRIHVVPWAVNVRPCAAPFAERRGLGVIGSFAHTPNRDAAYWLLKHVMPMVWARQADISCLIAGHGWRDDALPRRDARVEVIGPVPDLEDFFGRIRLTVAPLRFGAGIKGKVLDSFAAGMPCVMSPIAAEGLPLRAPLETLQADGPEAMAQTILRLHADEAAHQAAAAAGLAMIAEEFSEHRVKAALERAVKG